MKHRVGGDGHRAKAVLGVDIGGVIIDLGDYQSLDRDPTEGAPLREIVGSRAALRRLSAEIFERVHLVSACSPATAAITRRRLRENGFCNDTGIGVESMRFCRLRTEKAAICAELGVTHFVDDRLEVLSSLRSVPFRYLLGADPDEVREFSSSLSLVTQVNSWESLVGLLTAHDSASPVS